MQPTTETSKAREALRRSLPALERDLPVSSADDIITRMSIDLIKKATAADKRRRRIAARIAASVAAVVAVAFIFVAEFTNVIAHGGGVVSSFLSQRTQEKYFGLPDTEPMEHGWLDNGAHFAIYSMDGITVNLLELSDRAGSITYSDEHEAVSVFTVELSFGTAVCMREADDDLRAEVYYDGGHLTITMADSGSAPTSKDYFIEFLFSLEKIEWEVSHEPGH